MPIVRPRPLQRLAAACPMPRRKQATLSAEARNKAQEATDAHQALRSMRVDVERSREQLLLNMQKARRLG